MEKEQGIIHEQGFPIGDGLGFKPLTEEEQKQLEKEFEAQFSEKYQK